MTGRFGAWWSDGSLRLAGSLLLASAWLEGRELLILAGAKAAGPVVAGEYLLAALAYVSACLGAALAILSGHLFDRIAVSPRWTPARTASAAAEQPAIATFPPPL